MLTIPPAKRPLPDYRRALKKCPRPLQALAVSAILLAAPAAGCAQMTGAAQQPKSPAYTNSLAINGSALNAPDSFTNSIGVELIRVELGTFRMGQTGDESQCDWDEQPVHKVTISKPFYMSQTEVTIDQFRQFRPGFKPTPGFEPYAAGMSWYDAVAFCKWLSDKEGIPYRLPTEAEWEYACRAGTTTPFSSGDEPPAPDTANEWGLKNMHTGVREWCYDWHGEYQAEDQTDPVGPEKGLAKIVRGGGMDSNDARYARSANRASIAPAIAPYPDSPAEAGYHPVGLRLVQAPMPLTRPQVYQPPFAQQCVRQSTEHAKQGPDPKKPFFRKRYLLPTPPENVSREMIDAASLHPAFRNHNHSPGLEVCPNGDVLMIIYTSYSEYEPGVSLMATRLRFGADQWDMPCRMFDFADLNDHCPLLWNDTGTLYFFWGSPRFPDPGAFPFQWISSTDNGATWSEVKFPKFTNKAGCHSRQPINTVLRDINGTIYVPSDGCGGKSVLWAGKQNGATWYDTGGRTNGRHTTFALLEDGLTILGMGGKNTNIDGFMPKSVSSDGGKTWQVSKTPFPAQGSNQRPSILRLRSGRLFFAADYQSISGAQPEGITEAGAYVALSDDDGKSWKIKTLPGAQQHESPSRHNGNATIGYSVARQAPNGIIHLITTMNRPCLHFALNEAWILDDTTQAQMSDEQLMKPSATAIAQVSQYRETYPSGKTKAEWMAGIADNGRYLLHGQETSYYENGHKQRQATYNLGKKVRLETHWAPDGTMKWQWHHRDDGTSLWTQYWPNGNKKAESTWRNFKCNGTATLWDESGNVISEKKFVDGIMSDQMPTEKSYTNSIGMKLMRIEAGTFEMGFGDKRLPDELVTKKSHFAAGDFDEQPTHRVRITKPFYMAACEVTNAQYEQFDPSHKEQRGRSGYSKADDEAVVFVNWHDAIAFCKWLSEREQLPYRLPTEAEWEYACRAGTTTAFHTGNTLPPQFSKEADDPLTVAKTPPNPWGLYDMHGNVEEWCHDWYGPYESAEHADPVGRADGDFKVARGGSHSTEPYYLRSSNRLGCHPDDRQYMIGFRVVLGEIPATEPLPETPPQRYQRNVRQDIPPDVTKGPDPDKPYFKGPRPYVRIPQSSQGPLFSEHNHFGAVTECPNGDLLAAWFTCEEEMGRELGVAASRLRHGHEQWEPASPFWDAPDRNDHTHTLWYDGKGNIWHFNGLAIKYRRLALLLRKSGDNGATWSKARIILDHNDTHPNKIHESVFRARTGEIIVPFDGPGGSVLAISRDEGQNWFDPGASIRGTHGGVLQLADGRLMAFGRHGAIEGKMPMSISADMGRTWTYAPSPFQSIHTGRRLALMRLKQGHLFIAAFCNQMMITDVSGSTRPITGLFAALSTDDGRTWPYRRLVTDDGPRREVATMDGDPIIMDASNSEPVGYLAVCQSADGIINLVSSYQHYAFNTKWLMTPPPVAPPPPPPPTARRLPVKQTLPNIYKPTGLPGKDKWQWSFSARNFNESDVVSISADGLLKIHTNDQQQFWLRTEKKEIFGPVNPKKGFTAEIKTQVLKRLPDQRGVDFELYDGAGSRYAVTITDTAVYWYQGTVMSSALLPFSQYVPLAEDLNNTDRMHIYRIAVREDRVAQVYRDGALLRVKPVEYRTPRSPYIYFGAGPGLEALVQYVSYDLDGPSRP